MYVIPIWYGKEVIWYRKVRFFSFYCPLALHKANFALKIPSPIVSPCASTVASPIASPPPSSSMVRRT